MAEPKALVITGDGINCDRETAWALEKAGFSATRINTQALLENPSALAHYNLCAIPGGFSFGDEIASGKVLAVKLNQRLKDELHSFVDKGNLVIGICNGFQVLVQLGLLPDSQPGRPRLVSLMRNSGKAFINRWVALTVTPGTVTPFFNGLAKIELPIRHGEGRLALEPALVGTMQESDPRHRAPIADGATADLVRSRSALRYSEDVNGSFDRIAALHNERGNVMGLMPHPEAFVRWSQHPEWTAQKYAKNSAGFGEGDAPGLKIFRNAAHYLDNN